MPLVVWVRAGRGKPAGFYVVDPGQEGGQQGRTTGVTKRAPPRLDVATDGDVYLFVAGGVTSGRLDPSVLVGMNGTHLLTRSARTGGALLAFILPIFFSPPLIFAFSSPDTPILGPVSHKRTVSLAVHPMDSEIIAVSGWTSLTDHQGVEAVHLTRDAGATWRDITGDLANATGVCAHRDTCGKWRPSALLVLPVLATTPVVLVGTVSGVYATAIAPLGAPVTWTRLGGCTELPLVLAAGLSYEPVSDTVVVATMGRGVYILPKASLLVRDALSI